MSDRTADLAATAKAAPQDDLSAAWQRLTAPDLEAFTAGWLDLQCRMLAGTTGGTLLLGSPGGGQPRMVVSWPSGSSPSRRLAAALDLVERGQRPVLQAYRETLLLARPILIEGETEAIVAIEMATDPDTAPATLMRHLEWGTFVLRDRLLQGRVDFLKAWRHRRDMLLDALAAALDAAGFAAACRALTTLLASRIGADRVAIGFRAGSRTRVAAVSHSAGIGRDLALQRSLAAAMDEAIDQRISILFPPQDPDEPVVLRAHAELVREQRATTAFTNPFMIGGSFAGAILAERAGPQPFTQGEVDTLAAVGAVLGPVLDEKRRNDRWLPAKVGASLAAELRRLAGPGDIGRKLAVGAAAALLAAAWFVQAPYRIHASARVEGQVERAVVAPFDGFIRDAPARAGDIVADGQLLALLDDRDLALERLTRITERQQRRSAYEKALGDRDRVQANVVRAQIEETEGQIALLDVLIGRARLTAPFAGVVVAGDLSRAIGATVRRGDALFRLAPLDAYRVALSVDELQIADVAVGQAGSLLTTSLPDQPFRFQVQKITPVAQAREGRTVFLVEAGLEGETTGLRPGMEGIAKIDVDRRRMVWIWTRTLTDWARLRLWAWMP